MQDSEFAGRVRRELELVAEVQRSLLPQTLPAVPGYSFWVSWQPAMTVSGDLYDFRTLPTGEILVIAGDVAGKSISAAMVMAVLAGMIPLAVEQAGADLTRLVGALNSNLCGSESPPTRFTTLIAVALDPVAHRLRVVNAGHNLGFIRRQDGVLENLCASERTGMPLGVLRGYAYSEAAFALRPGDAVIIATDGVTNAVNSSGEEYGESRWHELLQSPLSEGAKVGEALLASVKAFAGSFPVWDDLLVVSFARE